jgi:hypothetical protein
MSIPQFNGTTPDQELRRQALEYAQRNASINGNAYTDDEVLDAAKKYYKFLLGDEKA